MTLAKGDLALVVEMDRPADEIDPVMLRRGRQGGKKQGHRKGNPRTEKHSSAHARSESKPTTHGNPGPARETHAATYSGRRS